MNDLSQTPTLANTENTDVSYTSVFLPEVMSDKFERHKTWLKSIRHEHPNPAKHYRIGVYIRFFNQTKYADYLENHKKQFSDTIALCPEWELVDFYIDFGSSAPNMESSPAWCKLLDDCFAGKIDLIITQKVSNICKDMSELALCARLLAAQERPIGVYIISEDIFTLATYYQGDLRDTFFLANENYQSIENGSQTVQRLLND